MYIVHQDEHLEIENIKTDLGNLTFEIGTLNLNNKYIGYLIDETLCPKCGMTVDGFYEQDYYTNKKSYTLECFECDYKISKQIKD